MSVLIKGMEMPKNECVGIFVYPDGRVHVWRSMSLVGQEYTAVSVPLHGMQLEQVLHAPVPRWIPVTERLPEECEDLDWHEEILIRFTAVWCYDAKTGTIGVRNRFQGKITGNEQLDQYTKDTDWHWSKSQWEPTHWMPRAPLQEHY